MAVFASGKLEAYVGPPGLGAADDLEAVIVEFIAGARSKLAIAVQELDSTSTQDLPPEGSSSATYFDGSIIAGSRKHTP